MSKNICNTIEPLLADYIDEKLSDSDARTVQRHLQSCSACASLEADRRILFTRHLEPLRDAKEKDVDWGRFQVSINERIDADRQRPGFRIWSSPAYALPVAALVIALVGLWIYSTGILTPSGASDTPYVALFSEEEIAEIRSIPETELESDSYATGIISDELTTAGQTLTVAAELNQQEILDEIDSSLLEMFDSEEFFVATMEYLETDDLIETLSDEEATLLASAMQIHDLGLD